MPFRPPIHSPYSLSQTSARRASNRERGSSSARGYDRLWERFRISFLASNPLCRDCESRGVVKATTDLHHVRKVRDHPQLRLDPSNILPLCHECHSIRTQRGE